MELLQDQLMQSVSFGQSPLLLQGIPPLELLDDEDEDDEDEDEPPPMPPMPLLLLLLSPAPALPPSFGLGSN
ncbi:MAG: hypothetical protein IPM54_32370 [Polyangiaceae bacterium]|nr:hypothetical protein [Polyangiaceae bacterium]